MWDLAKYSGRLTSPHMLLATLLHSPTLGSSYEEPRMVDKIGLSLNIQPALYEGYVKL